MNDLKFAFRQLLKSPGYTTVAVMMLAVGIGANTALFSIVNGVLLRPLPFPEQKRLVTLWERSSPQGRDQQRVSPPAFAAWQTQSHSFEGLGFWTGPTEFNLITQDHPVKVRACYASSALFRILGVEPQFGRGFLDEEDRRQGPQVAVISHKLWQERFGGVGQPLGESLTVDTFGRRTYRIVGIMPPGFNFPEDTELWLPAGWNGLPENRREGHWLNVLGRLKPGVTRDAAASELNTIQSRLAEQSPVATVPHAVAAVPLLEQMVGPTTRTALLTLWAVVAGVLLIACANVANLMLARTARREREIALRVALGASRWRIVRQLLSESLLLAFAGAMVGTLLAFWSFRLLIAASPADIPRLAQVSIDGTALTCTLVAAIITGIGFGLAPAWLSSRPDPNEALKQGSSQASAGLKLGRTHRYLVIVEVALATVMLVGASLMLQSFRRLRSTDRGFRSERLLAANLDFSVAGFTTWVQATETRPQAAIRQLILQLQGIPGVEAVGAASAFFRTDNLPPNQRFSIFGKADLSRDERPMANFTAISPGYLDAVGVRLLRGRELSESDKLMSPAVVLVNESFVRRFFGKSDPIGAFLSLDHSAKPLGAKDVWGLPIWSEIVGVTSDVKSLTLRPEPVPDVYASYWQWPMQSPTLFVRFAGDSAASRSEITRRTRLTIPSLPGPLVRLVSERVSESMALSRFQAEMLNLFGAVSLFLAACGIYGLIAHSVTQRRREIGIRIALGAKRTNIFRLILSQGMKPVLAGVGIGAVAALAVSRILRALLYGVDPADPLAFALTVLLLTVVASLACWIPASRASRLDPIEALRCE